MIKKLFVVVTGCLLVSAFCGCGQQVGQKQFAGFVDEHVAKVEPLFYADTHTQWKAETTGEAAMFAKLKQIRLQVNDIYSDRDDFEFLKKVKASGTVTDPALSRQLDRLYYSYLQSRVEPELLRKMVDLDTDITERYNNYRSTIDGREVTQSDIYRIMTTTKDCVLRKKTWLASKQVGNVIIDDLLKLVRMRNRAARQLGFDNHHTRAIVTGEQDVAELDRIFAELDELTRQPYKELKAEVDIILAESYGIGVDELMPWHYHDPFFQRTPLVYEFDLDLYYKDHDVKLIAQKFYAGVNLSVDRILADSDLYDKPGKNPHAFAIDMDRKGDARILCNLNNDERWAETILHELGHAVYAKYHDNEVPYLLREPAHPLTTEAIAMFFGRLSRNAAWMQQMLGLSDTEYAEVSRVSSKYLQFQQILFARWAMVMYNFEKQLYADPDQDLNTLWWGLVERYQMAQRPPGRPDAGWASKLHFTVAPCYYHNYMMGEMFASQLHHYIAVNILKPRPGEEVSYVGQKRAGDYIRTNVLEPAALYHWNEMIERATGEPLTPKYFVEQFLN